jgi:hypothetical protein
LSTKQKPSVSIFTIPLHDYKKIRLENLEEEDIIEQENDSNKANAPNRSVIIIVTNFSKHSSKRGRKPQPFNCTYIAPNFLQKLLWRKTYLGHRNHTKRQIDAESESEHG